MYTHVSKCKNNRIKERKKIIFVQNNGVAWRIGEIVRLFVHLCV
jgi:hypothetical protein